MAATELATAYVSLVPSFQGVQGGIARELAPVTGEADRVGTTAGRKFGGSFAAGFKKLIGPALALAGTAAVGGFIKDSISGASDLSESASKVGVVFGKQADQIQAASETSATSMGLSKQAYLEATGTLGNLLVSLDIGPKKAAGLSTEMVKLAGDLASFNNASPEEALDALKSGLTGETEPLKRFGVNMNDATLKAQAMKMGLIKSTKDALSPQTKALAAQALIMDQTGTAQGDFARTSGGLANQQRILGAEFDNLKATVGTALLPIVTKFVVFLTQRLLPGLTELGPTISRGVAVVKTFFAGLRGDIDSGSGRFAQFRTTVASVWASVKTIFANGVSIVRSLWAAFGANIIQYAQASFTNIMTIIRGAFTVIRGIFQTVSALLKGDWRGVWEGIKTILRGAWTLIQGIVAQGWNLIRFAFKNAGVVVKAIFREMWSGLGNLARAGLDAIVSAVRSLPGKIRALGGLLKSAGKHVLDSLLNGLKGGAGFVSEIAGNIWDVVKGSINAAISKINNALPNKLGKGKISVDLPDNPIPQLAKGGLVKARPGGTLAIIGEAGKDEMVVPMDSGMGDGSNISPLPTGGGSSDVIALLLRLIDAVEAGHVLRVGGRDFALAVQDAENMNRRQR